MPSSTGSGAVVFSGGVDGVLARCVVLVHVDLAVSEIKGKLRNHRVINCGTNLMAM